MRSKEKLAQDFLELSRVFCGMLLAQIIASKFGLPVLEKTTLIAVSVSWVIYTLLGATFRRTDKKEENIQ